MCYYAQISPTHATDAPSRGPRRPGRARPRGGYDGSPVRRGAAARAAGRARAPGRERLKRLYKSEEGQRGPRDFAGITRI
jgi:hypothetical protein